MRTVTIRTVPALLVVFVLYVMTLFTYPVAQADDAPGIILFFGLPCFLSGSYILYRVVKAYRSTASV